MTEPFSMPKGQIGLDTPLDSRSCELRRMVIRCLRGGRRGHLGASFSLIEILRVLYDDILRHDPARPDWQERDRMILSKGHGCLAQYALLADHGYFAPEALDAFCHHDGILGGHPDAAKIPGVEASTGALGHGLPIGVGRALALKRAGSDSRVFVVLGDGECNEGSVWEAALSAGNRGLDNLTLLVDYNKNQSYGPTYVVQDLEPLADKWRAFGLAAVEVDGHDVEALRATLSKVPLEKGKPTAIVCHTVKGKGVQFAENNLAWHHKSKIQDDDIAAMLECLGGWQ